MESIAARGAAQPGKLKVGLAVCDLTAPMWVEALSEALLRTGRVELRFIVKADQLPAPAPRPDAPGRLWRAYLAADLSLQRLACAASADPSATADLRRLGCVVTEEPGEDLELVVNAAGPQCTHSLSEQSGVQVWWFDHDGHASWPAVSSGYPETLTGRRVTRCRLMSTAPGKPPCVLRSAAFATHPLFAAENRVQLLWKGISLLVQKVQELQANGEVVPESTRPGDGDAPPGEPTASSSASPHAGRSRGAFVGVRSQAAPVSRAVVLARGVS